MPVLPETLRGLVISIASSLAFAGIYFVTPLLAPASAESLWALRNIITLPVIALALATLQQRHLATELARRIRRNPALIFGVIASGTLVAAQLWVFTWAPLHGKGLDVALGYFLLPLVLIIVGRVLYRDTLRWWQWSAAGIAALGVIYEVVRVGTVSWATLLVCLGYPVYFVLRQKLGFHHLGGMFWEFIVLSPLALLFFLNAAFTGNALQHNPALLWAGPLFALWSALALILYLAASRLLSLSLFGLLSYVEPALLVAVALLNGERISQTDTVLYVCIWCAVAVLIIGGAVTLIHQRLVQRRGRGHSDGSDNTV